MLLLTACATMAAYRERGLSGELMHVDDVVEAIFRALCARQRAAGLGAALSLLELQVACGVTSDELAALYVLDLTAEDEPRIALPTAITSRSTRHGSRGAKMKCPNSEINAISHPGLGFGPAARPPNCAGQLPTRPARQISTGARFHRDSNFCRHVSRLRENTLRANSLRLSETSD
jgi:hypothetical protein